MAALINQLKAEALTTPYTGPNDASEPYECSEAHENEQALKVLRNADFPTQPRFVGMVRALLVSHGMVDCVDVFEVNEDLVYESTAKLFYMNAPLRDYPVGPEFRAKARGVGEVLDAEGGINLMRCTFYAVSWLSQILEGEVGTGPSPPYMSVRPIDASWRGVGEWSF